MLDNIKDHTALLSSRAKKYSDDYSANAQKMKVTDALKAYFLLQLAEVNNKLESGDSFTLQALKNSFENESFSVKLNDNNAFSRFRGLPSQESINQVIDKYGALAVEYFNKPLFDHEKATIKFYGYSQSEWDALKVQDAQAAKDLVDATVEMARAVQIPATYGDVALSAFTLFKSAKALSKVNLKDVKEFATQAKALKNELVNISESLKKFFAKNPAKAVNNLPCFNAKSFHSQSFNTQAIVTCSFLSFLRNEVINVGQNQSLKRLHQNGGIPINDILKNSANSKYFKNKLLIAFKEKSQAQELYNALNSSLTIFKNSSVVQVRKVRNFDLYTVNLEPFKIGNVISLKNAGMTLSGKFDDFPKASKIFIQQHPELIPTNIKNILNTQGINEAAKEFEKLRLRWGLTWHHLEDLEGLILVPGRIHAGISHWGANAVISRIESGSDYLKTLWKNMMVY